MASNKPLISEDVLEEMAFRRCTWWSNLIENFAERDDGEEYDILSMDQQFKDDYNVDDREDVEEAEEVQVKEDIDDFSLMSMTTEEKRNTIIEHEDVQDLLNATRPIIEEHERKWREAGLERIMNTFDSVRIENEVGGWMRRNGKNHSFGTFDSKSDTDSSVSIEMDHYIRSIQRNNPKGRNRNYIQNFKRHQNYLNISVENNVCSPYDCPCYKYSNNPRKNNFKACPSIDKDKKRELPAILKPERFTKHCRRDYSSSSDSDDSFRKRFPGYSIPYAPIPKELSLATEATSPKKLFHTKYNNRRLESMIDYKCSTPPTSNNLNFNPTYTAPTKIRNKREAAKKALSKLNAYQGNSAKPNKIKKNSKSSGNNGDCNETFDEDVKKAIALSLHDYENYSKQKYNLMNLDNPFRLPVNGESSSDAISSNGSNKEINFDRRARANKISRYAEEAKENTFLSSVDNICNSTALNSIAARKQLHNRLPSIREITELMPITPPQQRIGRNEIPLISDMNESAIYGSSNLYKMGPKLIREHNSIARNDVVTDKKYAPSLSPIQGKNKGGLQAAQFPSQLQERRGGATEPRAKKKRSVLANHRISLGGSCNFSPIISNNSTTPKKFFSTPMSVEKIQKPKRLLIYTPNQKEARLNDSFQVTKELLSNIVGEERARRFLKYNMGRLTFPKSSTVYYCPPEVEPSSSDSDDDPLIKAGCYGDLCESD